MRRRHCLALTLTSLLPAASAWAASEKVITLIVPFAAGGGVDSTARLVAQQLSEQLRQPVVVDNVAGASGTIGTQKAVRAPADGSTLLLTVNSSITVAPLTNPSSVRYEPLRDLVPLTTTSFGPLVLVGKNALPSAAAAMIELARAQPGKLTLGTDGVGTSLHMTAELIKQRLAITTLHVPYKGGPQVLTDLAGGQIDLAVLPLTLVLPFIRDSKVRAYGVTSKSRWPGLPDIPALAELPGLAGFEMEYWLGLFAPGGTPSHATAPVVAAVAAMVKNPEVVRKMGELGTKPGLVSGAEFAQLLADERNTFMRVVKTANIKAE